MKIEDIKRLRNKQGLSQSALAAKAGITQAHIAKIESGKTDPRFSTVEKIFNILTSSDKDFCSSYMTGKILSAKESEPAEKIAALMREKSVSQLPVVNGCSVVGLVTEEGLLRFDDLLKLKVRDVMEDAPPLISKNTSRDSVKEMLVEFQCVIVMEAGKPSGIITRSDLLQKKKA